MIDFIAKARANRIIALNLSTKGAEMFFPKDGAAKRDGRPDPRRGTVTHVSESMRLRSQLIKTSAMIETPDSDMVANVKTNQTPQDGFELNQEVDIADASRAAA